MNWDAIGALGELGAFLAVLLTLILIYRELDHLQKQHTLALAQSASQKYQDLDLAITKDPELAEFIAKLLNDDSTEMTIEQQLRARAFIRYQLLSVQHMFLFGQRDVRTIRLLLQAEFARRSTIQESAAMDQAFHAFVTEVAESTSRKPS